MVKKSTVQRRSSVSESGGQSPDDEARETRRKNTKRNIGYIVPRGLSRPEACSYVGISETLFGMLVESGLMPRARALNGRIVWDRFELDEYFEQLPYHGKQKNRPLTPKEELDRFFGV